MDIEVKICGLSSIETVSAALDAGARYIGFVFYSRSPRNISTEKAAELCALIENKAMKVGVFVNPGDEQLSAILKNVDLDFIQLHGNESVERVQYIQKRFDVMVIKAISVAAIGDISRAREYEKTADMLLFDARAPLAMGKALPGGNGLEFDWNLIAGKTWHVPWMLSGGLDIKNVAEAVNVSGAKIVDISSGLENEPGDKDINKIKAFMTAVREVK